MRPLWRTCETQSIWKESVPKLCGRWARGAGSSAQVSRSSCVNWVHLLPARVTLAKLL